TVAPGGKDARLEGRLGLGLLLLARRARLLLLHRDRDGDQSAGARDLAPLELEQPQQLGLAARARVVAREDVGGGPGLPRLADRALALEIEVVQEELRVLREVMERDQEAGLLVIVVVAL